MLPSGAWLAGIAKLTALAASAAFCAACASLAHEKTRELCAPGANWADPNGLAHSRFVSRCLVHHNATILRAQQDFADYSQRLDALVASPERRQEYAALRRKIVQSAPAPSRMLALTRLGSLQQWLERQEGLDLHRWHRYSPAIQQVVANKP